MSETPATTAPDMSGYLSTNVYDGIRIMSPQEVERRRKWLREHFPELLRKLKEKQKETNEEAVCSVAGSNP